MRKITRASLHAEKRKTAETVRCTGLRDVTTDVWLDKLIGVEDIDVGEAQLLAAAAESETIFLTGDKRALQALKDLTDFTQVLGGKIAVLEAVLLKLCHQIGTEEVRRRIVPLAASDKMIEICFSKQNHDPPQGLQSYYKQLAEDLMPLILWELKA
jgi:hypothetical protein